MVNMSTCVYTTNLSICMKRVTEIMKFNELISPLRTCFLTDF